MSRPIGANGLALIKEFEGCKLIAYKAVATEKYYTIGWGHYGKDVTAGMKITQQEADNLLVKDCQKFANYVDNPKYVTAGLNDNQRDALISFAYNCGAGNLKELCYGKSVEQIAKEITLYNKASGKVLKGLVRRRNKELTLFNTPVANGTLKDITTIAREVLADKWGKGATRKENLERAGYNYQAVQAEVNRLIIQSAPEYFPIYKGKSYSIIEILNSFGVPTTFTYRQKLAKANAISGYSGTAKQNLNMVSLAKIGKLRRV